MLLHFSRVRDARGTCRRVKAFINFSGPLCVCQTRDTADSKLGRFCGVQAARTRGKTSLTWDPRMQGNFELETPNSVGW